MTDKELTKAIVKTAILELDLEMTKKMANVEKSSNDTHAEVKLLRQEIPALIDKKIRACQLDQSNNKKWNIRTLLIILGLLGSYGFSVYSIFGG